MNASDIIDGVAQMLYKQAGYDELYAKTFPNRAWDKLSDKSKERWYWKARKIFNFVTNNLS